MYLFFFQRVRKLYNQMLKHKEKKIHVVFCQPALCPPTALDPHVLCHSH